MAVGSRRNRDAAFRFSLFRLRRQKILPVASIKMLVGSSDLVIVGSIPRVQTVGGGAVTFGDRYLCAQPTGCAQDAIQLPSARNVFRNLSYRVVSPVRETHHWAKTVRGSQPEKEKSRNGRLKIG